MNETTGIEKNRIINSGLFMILLPAFFLIHNYNEVFGFLPARILWKSGFFIFAGVIIVYWIAKYFLRSGIKAALCAFLLCLFFLFFGPFHGFLRNVLPNSFFSRYVFLLPAMTLISALFIWKIFQNKTTPSRLVRYLNVVMIVLVLTELGTSFVNGIDVKNNANLIYPDKPLCRAFTAPPMADSSKPDIFLLVFDEYTASRTLQSVWNYNNRNITDWLNAQDFYVPSGTNANYPCTFFSLPSMFNMNFLDPKKAADATVIRGILQGIRSLSDNESFCMLEKQKYSIRFFAPFKNRFGENGLGNYFDPFVTERLYLQTVLGSAQRDLAWNFIGRDALHETRAKLYRRLQEKVTETNQIIRMVKSSCNQDSSRNPQFVYAHFMITHEPNVFDSAGGFSPELDDFSNAAISRTYTSEIKYANKVIKALVTFIKTHNKKNSIILVMGDHGFKEFSGSLSIPMEYSNFTALYFPDKDYKRLYENVSPVNIFRIVFNQFFSQHYPLLKDSLVSVRLQ